LHAFCAGRTLRAGAADDSRQKYGQSVSYKPTGTRATTRSLLEPNYHYVCCCQTQDQHVDLSHSILLLLLLTVCLLVYPVSPPPPPHRSGARAAATGPAGGAGHDPPRARSRAAHRDRARRIHAQRPAGNPMAGIYFRPWQCAPVLRAAQRDALCLQARLLLQHLAGEGDYCKPALSPTLNLLLLLQNFKRLLEHSA